MRWLGDTGPALMEVRSSLNKSPLTDRTMIYTMMAKGLLTSADQPCSLNLNRQGIPWTCKASFQPCRMRMQELRHVFRGTHESYFMLAAWEVVQL